VCVCVCVCVRARARACVRACVQYGLSISGGKWIYNGEEQCYDGILGSKRS
jgi:hypothetical protein